MNNLQSEYKMTVREVAAILGVTPEAIKKHVRKLFPQIIQNGQPTYLNEYQVTTIKWNMRPTTKVVGAKTELDKKLIVKQAIEILLEDLEMLKTENKQLKPKAERLDLIAGSEGLILPREAGKIITGHPNNFIQWMVDKKIFYRSKGKLVPYSEYQNRGYFKVKESFNEIKNQTYIQTYFTPKGVDWISAKYREAV